MPTSLSPKLTGPTTDNAIRWLMRLKGRTVWRMEPKTREEEIAELEALIERLKADLVIARKALEADGEATPFKPGNGA